MRACCQGGGAWGDHSQYPRAGRGNTMTHPPLSPVAGRGNAMTCVALEVRNHPPLPMRLVVVPTTHACDMRAIGAQAIRAQAM